MCLYVPHQCSLPAIPQQKPLTLLILDCWQREYGKRPYRHFDFHRLAYEGRMRRPFYAADDLQVITEFLQKRTTDTATFVGLHVPTCNEEILQNFGDALLKLTVIKLEHMALPNRFFTILHKNSREMAVSELSLKGTHLSFTGALALSQFLIESLTMSFLNVASCNVDHSMFTVIADGMHKCATMCGYDASRMIGGYGLTLDTMKIAHIVSSLIWQGKFEVLVMRHCGFYPQDMAIMCEYVPTKGAKLKKLDFGCNHLGVDGVDIIFRAILAAGGGLRTLDVSSNGLGVHGGRCVLKYLSSCCRLEHLNIADNNIDAETVNYILTCLRKSVPLLTLQIYPNKFNEKTTEILHRILDARTGPQVSIDITVRFDETTQDYCLLPIDWTPQPRSQQFV